MNLVALGAYVVIVEPEGGRDVTLIAPVSQFITSLPPLPCRPEASRRHLIGRLRSIDRAQAAKLLASDGVRAAVVSAPCFDLFRQQSREYRPSARKVPRIGVEAAVEGDWARWLGDSGEFVGMTGFGASAPAEVLYREFGITAEAVATAAVAWRDRRSRRLSMTAGGLKGTSMARITLRQLLDHAAEHGYGVPAFNINNMEQGLAIMEAAAAVDAPVIIQASRGARSYANDIMLSKMIDALEEMYPQIPLCMHQDHGNEEATCATALQHGFTSVMMDGSLKADAKTAADYDYNVDITRRVVEMAHWIGASVEGELGVLGSLEHGGGEQEDGHGVEGKVSHDQLLTDPDQAVDFVRATKVDALAIAMGTSHGAYKFSRKPDGDILAMNVVEEIHRRLPNTHLVMHGSSSVPQPLQDMFNAVRRRDAADLGRAGRGDRARHQAWRSQGQYRHRLPAGDDRGVPEGRDPDQERIRPAQIPQARDGRDARALPRALRAIRHRGQCREDQGDPAVGNGQALSRRLARSAYRRHGRRSRITNAHLAGQAGLNP